MGASRFGIRQSSLLPICRCPLTHVYNLSRSAETPLRSTHTLPDRIYGLSYASSTSTLLISMAHRHVSVYSLNSLASAIEGQVLKPEQQRESALKFLTRAIACMVDGKGRSNLTQIGGNVLIEWRGLLGWASGSIEGRIAVEYFDADPAAQSQKYAFRAHRQTVDGVDCVYPINALAYHPMYVGPYTFRFSSIPPLLPPFPIKCLLSRSRFH